MKKQIAGAVEEYPFQKESLKRVLDENLQLQKQVEELMSSSRECEIRSRQAECKSKDSQICRMLHDLKYLQGEIMKHDKVVECLRQREIEISRLKRIVKRCGVAQSAKPRANKSISIMKPTRSVIHRCEDILL